MTDYTGGLASAFVLDADHVVTTTTATDVPGMVCSVSDTGLYVVMFAGSFISNTQTSGIGLQLLAPASSRVMGMNYNLSSAAQAMGVGEQVASGALSNNGTSGVRSANVEVPVQGMWSVRTVGTGGVIQLQARPEIAATMTLKSGSTMIVWAF